MAEARAASGPRRRRILCRNFVCGVCKWGHSCYYSHDLSMLKSSQICKHYLSGFCFYGNSCRYLHIQPAGWLSGNRRGSEPALQLKAGESSQRYHGMQSSDPTGGNCSRNRRSSAPAIPRIPGRFFQQVRTAEHPVHSTTAKSTWGRRGSEPAVSSFTHFGRDTRRSGTRLEEDVDEVKENETPEGLGRWAFAAEFVPPQFQKHGCASTSQAAGPFSYLPGSVKSESQTVLTPESSTSQSVPQGKLTKDSAFEESKDIICGICMEKVYEKTPARDRCFAILPDCNHAFCVTCIKKWRESKGFTNNVIKACPECRVVASYFIPYKYWVVDEQKQKLIEKFKVEKRKIHCKFFLRSNGRCPFKSECIYLHEFPEGYRPSQHRQRRRRDSSPLGIMWEDDCDDEDYYHALHLLGVLTLNDSFLENLAHFEYELFDSDLSDFNQDDSDSDDDDFAI
ncbi:makorin, ring finger protein, 4 isoform X1 [Stegostoma tigrinum]|uniref:makorin, ring finger protein, 4 isoform X1 n=1 Tax=Stegostoma tigrinum TaxID=3053191 RepID=UPI00202B8D89|nr:makorin, ring finger protein, 4 isoform X1 [Stegostoma tigrinum]